MTLKMSDPNREPIGIVYILMVLGLEVHQVCKGTISHILSKHINAKKVANEMNTWRTNTLLIW